MNDRLAATELTLTAMTEDADAHDAPPAGFKALPVRSGYMGHFGALYFDEARGVIGTRVSARHLNNLDIAHGGMLATLADTAIGAAMIRAAGRERPAVTAHLGLDYLGSVRAGDWLEAHVELDKMGARLRFATCRLMVGSRCVLKANATFAVLTDPA
jgi:acyl-coenzyme A thioesterase 13